jgi:Divergent InlB B-repeat domain/PEP-CTERM motif
MREGKRQLGTPLFVGLLFALTIVGVTSPAQAQASGYELCVEYSPARAGTVTPDSGTHHFSANTVVTLSAEPQPGYQFAYWIGDVSNPKTPSTTVRLDTSKIVVAVFKPTLAEETEPKISIGGGGGGGGSLVPMKVDLSTPGFSIAGGSGGGTRKVARPVPVIVTPEPATVFLLGLGTFALRRKRR